MAKAKKEKKETIEMQVNPAIKALDEQIVLVREELRIVAEDPAKGPACDEYAEMVKNLNQLVSARHDLAVSEGEYVRAQKEGQREKLSWNTVVGVAANVGIAGLMFLFEREHVLPKSAMKFIETLKSSIKPR